MYIYREREVSLVVLCRWRSHSTDNDSKNVVYRLSQATEKNNEKKKKKKKKKARTKEQ